MGLFRRTAEARQPPPADGLPANEAPTAATSGASLDDVLTTLSSVLRTFGQLRFPIGEHESDFHAESEDWARHVMSGSPPPRAGVGEGRNWRGVREHVRKRRVAERDYIESRLGGFTDVLADVMRQMQSLVGSNEASTTTINKLLDDLGRGAENGDLEELRHHVRTTLRAVRDTVENQRSQFSDKVRSLGERLALVHEDLDAAREDAKLDPLTQLYTGTALRAELQRGSKVAELSAIPLTLICARIDDFERFATNHGLETSNIVLCAVADCISLCFFRRSDFVARIDDHHFAVLLWDTELGTAERSAERLLEKARRLRVGDQQPPLEVTLSVGVCQRGDGDTSEQFLQRAIDAAEHARAGGGDRRERG